MHASQSYFFPFFGIYFFRKQRELITSLSVELGGFKSLIKAEQDKLDRITHIQGKVDLDANRVEREMTAVQEEKEKLASEFGVFQKKLESLEEELTRAQAERQRVLTEQAQVQKQADALRLETKKLESAILENAQQQVTQQKSAKSVQQMALRLRSQSSEKVIHFLLEFYFVFRRSNSPL